MGREVQIRWDRHDQQFKAGLVTYFTFSAVPENFVKANVSTSKQHSGSKCFFGFWIISDVTVKAKFFIQSGVFFKKVCQHNIF